MRQLFITSVLVMAAVMTPRSSLGQNSTPGSNRAISLGLADYEWGNQGAMVVFVAPACDYRLDIGRNIVLNDSPPIRVSTLRTLLNYGYGWWFISSHGDSGSLWVEPYLTTNARDASLAAYLAAGYPSSWLESREAGSAKGISVTVQFIWENYSDRSSLVHISSCNSLSLDDGFLGRKSFVGYNYACRVDTSTIDTRELYSRMAGWQGVAKRTLSQAYLGTTLAPPLGNGNLVLAPIVSATNLTAGGTISRSTSAYVRFDCPMYTSVPANQVAQATGALDISGASWQGNDQIAFTVTGRYRGSGAVMVVTDTSSITFGGAQSWPGYIHLIGNQNGGDPPQNGWAPSGDYVINMVSEIGGDNPKADVSGFSIVTAGAGVAVKVVVEAEYQTDRYLIQHASDRAGPFVTLAKIQASGPQVHQLTIPGAPMDGVYQLLEVEASGRVLQHGLTEVTAPLTPASEEAPEISTETESILEFYRQQYLAAVQAQAESPQGTENWEYHIFTRSVFSSRAQSYLGFLGTKGIRVGSVYTLESIGGAAMIKPYVDGLRGQGGRYFLRYGDGNDDSDINGVPWWSDNARWINGFVRGSFPSQAAYNLVPGKYFAVTDSQHVSMTGTTPYFPSDSWFIDFDNDSLPDPGLAFGNAPVRSDAEAANWNLKQMNAWNMSPATSYMNHVGAWIFGQDYIGNDGEWAVALAESVLQRVPVTMVIDRVVDANPAAPMLPSERNTAATNAYTQGRSLIFGFGTISSGRGTHLAAFWDKYFGFNPSSLPSNSTRLPFMLVPSCGSMNTDETENPAAGFGRPLMDLFSVLPDKGPWGGCGPTRGSWQQGNFEAADAIMARLYEAGSRSTAMACFEGLYLAGNQDPYHKPVFMSYRFVGCPAVKLVNMRSSTVDVGDQPMPSALRLERPFPNPTAGASTFRFSLPVPAQVKLRVYDLPGRLIRTLVNAPYPAGHFTVSWDGTNDNGQTLTGMHFVLLEAGGQKASQKVIRAH